MRVAITTDPGGPHRDRVRDDAEFWCGNRARAGSRVREREDCDGREVLVSEFRGPLDGIAFSGAGRVAENECPADGRKAGDADRRHRRQHGNR
jgi:hypothetical protein